MIKSKLADISKTLGKARNWLNDIKRDYPEQFEWMASFDDNLLTSIHKYLDDRIIVRKDIEAMYWELLETRGRLTKLGKELTKLGMYANSTSFSSSLSSILGSSVDRGSYRTYRKHMEILRVYNERTTDTKENP